MEKPGAAGAPQVPVSGGEAEWEGAGTAQECGQGAEKMHMV